MKKGKGKFIISSILLLFLFFGSIAGAQVQEILLGKVGQPLYTLTVMGSGAGTGIVTGDLYGINCTSTAGVESGVCLAQIPMGTTVILTATPSGDHFFDGWSGGGCTGTGTCTLIISGNTSVDAEFILAPQNANLIAWYKFDEGSGTVVYNQATDGSSGGGLFPNLGIVGLNTFWSAVSGFGKKSTSATQDFAWNKPNRTIGGASGWGYGRFLRIIGDGGVSTRGGDVITSGIQACIQTFPSGADVYSNANNGGASASLTVTYNNVWLFHFIANDGIYRVCKADGTIVTGTSLPAGSMVATITPNYLLMGFQYATEDPPVNLIGINPTIFGDWILYSGTTLTVAQWGQWYDKLRTRYGMAARSGW